MGSRTLTSGAALAIASALASSAFAAGIVVATDDYSGTDAEWCATWGNGYGPGTNPPYTNEIVSGARKITMDFSGVQQADWGTWMGMATGSWMDIANQPHSGSRADYTVSADLKFVGSFDNTSYTKARIQLQFFTPDDTNPDGTPVAVPDADDDAQAIAEFKFALGVMAENTWTTRQISLADFVPVTWDHDNNGNTPQIDRYTWDDTLLALSTGSLGGINFSINMDDGNGRTNWGEANPALWQYNNGGGFGLDSGNEVWFDNTSVTVVPEPSSLAAIAGLGLILARRRK